MIVFTSPAPSTGLLKMTIQLEAHTVFCYSNRHKGKLRYMFSRRLLQSSSLPLFSGTTTLVDDTSLTYSGSGWQSASNAQNVGGSDHYTTTAGNSASYTAMFSTAGTIAVIVKKASHHGIMTVSIDGGATTNIDLYAASDTYNVTAWTSPSLNPGSHTITITATSSKNANSSGTVAEIDALRISGTTSSGGGGGGGSQPTGFLQRSGTSITLNGAAWRASGVNLPWSLGCGSEVNLPPTFAMHQTMFQSAKPNSIYRLFLFGGRDLNYVDQLLDAARPYGHRFILCLSDAANGCGEPYCGPNPTAFYNGGWISGGWRDNWLTPVVNRYKNEPLVGWWEWCNEPSPSQAVRNFFDACGAYVRNTLGDTHLIGTGTMSEYGDSTNMRLINGSPYIDLCSEHEYDENQAPSYWTTADAADAAAVGKPWYVGESGIKGTTFGDGTPRANQIKAKMVALKNNWPTCIAYIYWSGSNPGQTRGSNNYEIGIVNTPEINVINTEPF